MGLITRSRASAMDKPPIGDTQRAIGEPFLLL